MNNDLKVAHPQGVLRLSDSWLNWNLKNVKMLVFEEEKKTGVPGEKPLGTKERTNNDCPHMERKRRQSPHKSSFFSFL